MKPTEKQIIEEIVRLNECLDFIPRFSKFGDDNFAAVTAAVVVLAERMTVDRAYELAGEEEPTYEDDARISAAQWLAGEATESPSAGWQSFRRTAKPTKKKGSK